MPLQDCRVLGYLHVSEGQAPIRSVRSDARSLPYLEESCSPALLQGSEINPPPFLGGSELSFNAMKSSGFVALEMA